MTAAGVLLGVVAKPAHSQSGSPDEPVVTDGELYGDFLLLATEGRLDYPVQYKTPISLHAPASSARAGERDVFDSPEALRAHLPFPIFTLETVAAPLHFLEASSIRYVQSGEVWSTSVVYGFDTPGSAEATAGVRLSAQPKFTRPLPVWPVHDPTGASDRLILAEKVSFPNLPPAVLWPGPLGYVVHWIEGDVLYTLVDELSRDRSALASTIARLARLQEV